MKSLKRRIADRIGDVIGVRLVPKAAAPYWPERFFFERMSARLKFDCVFDVGANEGQFGEQMRNWGFDGLILSFEPNPDAYDRLVKAAAGDRRWFCHPYAFGREEGAARFNVMAHDVFSSFRTPLASDGAYFAEQNSVARTVEVSVKRLADVYPELQRTHGFATPFLKMDTQGFDLEVFAGAGAFAREFCALVSEMSVRQIYEDAPDLAESLAAYVAGGFAPAAFHSVHPGLPLKAIEFNCYCVRDDLIDATAAD